MQDKWLCLVFVFENIQGSAASLMFCHMTPHFPYVIEVKFTTPQFCFMSHDLLFKWKVHLPPADISMCQLYVTCNLSFTTSLLFQNHIPTGSDEIQPITWLLQCGAVSITYWEARPSPHRPSGGQSCSEGDHGSVNIQRRDFSGWPWSVYHRQNCQVSGNTRFFSTLYL